MADFIICAHCKIEAPYFRGKAYCSRGCKEVARQARRSSGIIAQDVTEPAVKVSPAPMADRHCVGCFTIYSPKSPRHKYCSRSCNERAKKFGKITCADCAEPMWSGPTSLPQGEARCTSCRSAPVFRELLRQRRAGRQRQYRHQRRALAVGGLSERYTMDELFERDGGGCGICGEDVDRTLRHPSLLSPSIDHVLPISRGGTDMKANVQITHLRCNLSKGARVLV